MEGSAASVMDNSVVTPDGVIDELKPEFFDGVQDGEVVAFRGLLGPKTERGSYQLFTSIRLDEWLEIPEAALLFQLPSKNQTGNAISSIVWVKHNARLVQCHRAKACQFADVEAEMGINPTMTGGGDASKPRYGP
jgi:hypothetical protein